MGKIPKIPSHIPVSDAHLSRPSPIDLINLKKKSALIIFKAKMSFNRIKIHEKFKSIQINVSAHSTWWNKHLNS